ncbi:nuclear transport factor 2 family protein [Nocardia terpenica]|nr:nuclear transport factor 2 family protein [Nocardia terpenica]MBF6103543.1 nuclear transport factor 2 family protein [Nocardia terpenica]MBF6112083.1 nuclear transport factor 2 family protein [Nocardia terpenica]MBF6117764.1 nuclear transport factor 2 family protein [Nocardia terpenica]MBF6153492.1 nuclear transport factor 2 family protein [Nocardia terpenica]
MSTIADFVERYTAVWNETDPRLRSKQIRELWEPDGHYANASVEYRGHERIAAAVTEAHDDFVANGFEFTVHAYQTNHDAVRITWHMVPAGGGEVLAVGTEFIVVNADGAIVTDYQFMDVDPTVS